MKQASWVQLRQEFPFDDEEPSLDQFISTACGLTYRPELQPYIADAVSELTAAIMNCKAATINSKTMNHKWNYAMELRDKIAQRLDISTKSPNFPMMLLSRQVQGPRPISRHALLMRNLLSNHV